MKPDSATKRKDYPHSKARQYKERFIFISLEGGKMTTEERQMLAMSGDVESMIRLAEFNLCCRLNVNGDEAEKFEKEAMKWLDMALTYDEPYAAYLLSKLKISRVYKTDADSSDIDLENAKKQWAEVCNLCERLCEYFQVNAQGLEKIDYNEVMANLRESTYKLALYKFFTGEPKGDVLSYLVDVENPKVAILRGVVLFEIANTEQKYSDAANLMMRIFDEEYITVEKTELDYRLFAYAALNLSRCCRIGQGIPADVSMAYEVLAHAKNHIKTQEALKMVDRELKLYELQGNGEYNYAG